MQIKIHWPTARKICEQLLAAFRNDEFPYRELSALPQNFIPRRIKEDDLLHARFLFYCCHYMRGSIRSDLAIKRLVQLWYLEPRFFDPFWVRGLNSLETLHDHLGELIGYKTDEITQFWHENSTRLAAHWGGDPRRIFDQIRNAEDLYRLTTNKKKATGAERGFLGFQEKMASMLAYFLMDAKLVPHFTASPPVDFHLVRVMLSTRMLRVTKSDPDRKVRYEHLTGLGVKVLQTYAHDSGASLVELGNAFWMISVILCRLAPGNRTSGRKKGVHGKKAYPEWASISWEKPREVDKYIASCGSCALEDVCVLNVASGNYYQTGELRMRERLMPPRALLHPLFNGERLPVKARPARPIHDGDPPPYVRRTTMSPILLFDDLHSQRKPNRELPNLSPPDE